MKVQSGNSCFILGVQVVAADHDNPEGGNGGFHRRERDRGGFGVILGEAVNVISEGGQLVLIFLVF